MGDLFGDSGDPDHGLFYNCKVCGKEEKFSNIIDREKRGAVITHFPFGSATFDFLCNECYKSGRYSSEQKLSGTHHKVLFVATINTQQQKTMVCNHQWETTGSIPYGPTMSLEYRKARICTACGQTEMGIDVYRYGTWRQISFDAYIAMYKQWLERKRELAEHERISKEMQSEQRRKFEADRKRAIEWLRNGKPL